MAGETGMSKHKVKIEVYFEDGWLEHKNWGDLEEVFMINAFRILYIEKYLLSKEGITEEETKKLEKEIEELKEEGDTEIPELYELDEYAIYGGIDTEEGPTYSIFVDGEYLNDNDKEDFEEYDEYLGDNYKWEETKPEDGEEWKNYILINKSVEEAKGIIEFEIEGEFDIKKFEIEGQKFKNKIHATGLICSYDGKIIHYGGVEENGSVNSEYTVYYEGQIVFEDFR